MPDLYKKLTIYLLVFMVLLLGCGRKVANSPAGEQKSEDTTIMDVTSYFPADKNYTWEYAGTGNEYAAFTRKVLYKESELVEITDNNGGTVMGLVFRVAPEAIVKIYSEPEFYEEKNILGTKPNLEEVILKSPLKVGAVWQDEKYKREVISIDETIEAPAGKYDKVVKVKITPLDAAFSQSESYEYYAKGIGLVMREYISGDMEVTSQLKSFEG